MTEVMQQMIYRGTPHTPDSLALDVANVFVRYASLGRRFATNIETVDALKNVTFQVSAGEHVAIIGPNGAGKSTLLKLVAGILKADSGSIEMFGTSPSAHICIAYVPQRSEIDWRFPVTVADVVMMGRTKQIGLFRRPGMRDHAVVKASLQRVQAVHLADKQIGELSGGQQQRVFIARALAMQANLLLMDEPLAGLDVPSQESTMAILDSLRPDGVTVLVATHDLGLAAERFDRIMLLNRRVIAFGKATAVLTTDNLLAAYGGHVAAPA